MSRALIVAEKPSVARDIARVLGVKGKGDGFVEGERYVVTWALGHLVRLCEPDEISPEYKRWSLAQLPIIPKTYPLKVIPKTRSQFAVVKKWMKHQEIDRLICATDAGREGELIFRLIYEMAGADKPVSRLWISSMTDEAIREGFAALRDESQYDALYRSALCRSRADWLIGMNLSRAYSVKYSSRLSVGRVQTPTLALLVRRQKEIDSFVPAEYFTVTADFGAYKGQWLDPHAKENQERLSSREQAQAVVRDVSGGAGTVTRCDTQEKREYAPKLYDLTTLQRDANRRYGLTAAKTLSIAQALYEKHKLITYPRTDCRVLPLDLRPQVLSTLQKLPSEYAPFVQTAVAGARKGGGVFQKEIGSDHHALIPTGKEIRLDKLPEGERKVMELILRRFLAAFFPPYVYLLQTIETQVESHLFRTALRARRDAGWKAVEGADSSGDEDALLTVREGERYPVQSAKEQAHMTTPPKPYTDATLLSAMENAGKTLEDEALRELMKQHGLGTPATRAGMIERLLEVGYAQRKGRSLVPTEKGNKLIAVVPEAIASAETTGKWEYALNLIADGRAGDADFVARFMTGIEDMTRKLTQTVAQDQPLLHFDPEDGGKKRSPRKKAAPTDLGVACPVCGQGRVTENEKAFGCSRWKEGCRFTLWKNGLQRAGGPALTAALVKLLLEKRSVAGSTGVLTLASEGVFFEEKKTGQTHGPYPLTYDKEKKRKP